MFVSTQSNPIVCATACVSAHKDWLTMLVRKTKAQKTIYVCLLNNSSNGYQTTNFDKKVDMILHLQKPPKSHTNKSVCLQTNSVVNCLLTNKKQQNCVCYQTRDIFVQQKTL